MIEDFIKSSFVFILLTFGMVIVLKILSDYITCIGIYHSSNFEKFPKKIVRILKYNYLLSLFFIFAFYLFIAQIIPSINPTHAFLLSASAAIVILVNARILANPTHYSEPIECIFYEGDLQEISKIKERVLSFYYSFISISVITIVVTMVYNQVFSINSKIGFELSQSQSEEILYIIALYFLILSLFTFVGEILLKYLDPIIKI